MSDNFLSTEIVNFDVLLKGVRFKFEYMEPLTKTITIFEKDIYESIDHRFGKRGSFCIVYDSLITCEPYDRDFYDIEELIHNTIRYNLLSYLKDINGSYITIYDKDDEAEITFLFRKDNLIKVSKIEELSKREIVRCFDQYQANQVMREHFPECPSFKNDQLNQEDILEVFKLMAFNDEEIYLHWNSNLDLFLNVNDLFGPGSDAESIMTKKDLFLLKKAFEYNKEMALILYASVRRNKYPRKEKYEIYCREIDHFKEFMEKDHNYILTRNKT